MSDLKYTKEHEWVKVEGSTAKIGITTYARHALGDLVYLELPEKGRTLAKGENFAVVESVKAASEIYTPVSGEIIDVNYVIQDDLDNLKEDPEKGWIIQVKISKPDEVSTLMNHDDYTKYTGSLI